MNIPSTEVQNKFGRYIKLAQFEDVIVLKNGKPAVEIKKYEEDQEQNAFIAEEEVAYDWNNEKISYEEFLQLSESSENRYEYIDGEVYLLVSPSYDHQVIITEVLKSMFMWFEGKRCRPLTAPFDVTLLKRGHKNVVQPDIIVICDQENINEKRRYTGVPTLIVEVLSESNHKKDMLKKLDLYISGGVKEYWIVSPFRKEVYIYSLEDFNIVDYKAYKNDDSAKSVCFEGLEISLKRIFDYESLSKHR